MLSRSCAPRQISKTNSWTVRNGIIIGRFHNWGLIPSSAPHPHGYAKKQTSLLSGDSGTSRGDCYEGNDLLLDASPGS